MDKREDEDANKYEEEIELIRIIELIQENYHKAIKPYVERLMSIRAMRPINIKILYQEAINAGFNANLFKIKK